MHGMLDAERIVAEPGYSRWLIPPAALAIHLSIGQVYAFSVFKRPLQAHFGTSLTAIAWVFSIAIVMLGLSAAFLGTWVERNGPRKAMFTSACCWASGFVIGSIGIATRQLWLLYLGYGVVGGIGLGVGYISPVSTLIKWFPDRPGLATGMAIMGFGGGALIASPLSVRLMQAFDPAVAASPTAIASGAAVMKTFLVLGVAYFGVMMFGVLNVRLPPGTRVAHPRDKQGNSLAKYTPLQTGVNISAANAIRTPQFWMLWVVLFCNVTAGIGILEQAAPMIQDFFRAPSSPTTAGGGAPASSVSAAVAGGFVGLLSMCNMAGRFIWSSTSDLVGRKRIYILYLGLGMVLYALLASVGAHSTALFATLAGVILSFYGGGFATIPAYLKDLFGTFQVGAIHGRLLTAWSCAGVAGPLIVNAIIEGRGKPGALTAQDYQPALFVMVGILAVGFVANLFVRPVHGRYYEGTEPAPVSAPVRFKKVGP
ncbi:OFA family MFS transporter [Pendulispora rubella]|uniref:OFA family MFS transporter n=1 Tax=Pendulispora rubella TaxID=2741070 RepID=A0ABZ2LFZ6_9BACT